IFWLVLWLSQRGIDRFARLGSLARKESLYRELMHEKAMRQRTDSAMIACVYQALSYFARGAIFLGFGLILASVTPVLLTVGAVGFLYYAYRGLIWLNPMSVEADKSELEVWQRIAEIETKLFGRVDADTTAKIESLKKDSSKK